MSPEMDRKTRYEREAFAFAAAQVAVRERRDEAHQCDAGNWCGRCGDGYCPAHDVKNCVRCDDEAAMVLAEMAADDPYTAMRDREVAAMEN